VSIQIEAARAETAEGRMAEVPFTLCYTLTRRQRLIPHLRLWGPHSPLILLGLVGFLAGIAWSWWCLPFALLWVWLFRRFFAGLLGVLLHPVMPMHIRVEENALGFMAGGQRWWAFLDGLVSIQELTPGVWTVLHWNGTVINVPAAAITDGQLAYLRAAMKRGRSPEQIQAVIERGRRLAREDEEERWRRQG
jgi:hypothetical protein